jgi:hypothetical protein
MSGRPEGTGGGYDDVPQDREAWHDFTPWRPGDKSETVPREPARTDPLARFKWTEEQPEVFNDGERVRSTRPVGGLLGGAVPAGSIGHVQSSRESLLGELYVKVKFDNGYVEEVKTSDIKREGWFG